MSKIWLASDFHLNHANIASPNTTQWKAGYRNFDSVEHMNHVLIDNINKYVGQDDELYFHGDFCFGGHHLTPDWRRRLYCKNLYMILGNHDYKLHLYSEFFNSVTERLVKTFKHDGRKVTFFMSHYAHRIWEGSHKGVYHTYGHSHDSLEHSPYGKSMDVGIDAAYRLFGEYRPFSLEEVLNILDKRDIEFPDHHSPETNSR